MAMGMGLEGVEGIRAVKPPAEATVAIVHIVESGSLLEMESELL